VGSTPTISAKELKALDASQGLFSLVEMSKLPAAMIPDALPMTDDQLRQLRPVRLHGRPVGSGSKVQTTIRFDEEVVDEFKSTGDGWQTRMNDALRQWIQEHRH
jgi:uncharacterized protein (DUF4415 family)